MAGLISDLHLSLCPAGVLYTTLQILHFLGALVASAMPSHSLYRQLSGLFLGLP